MDRNIQNQQNEKLKMQQKMINPEFVIQTLEDYPQREQNWAYHLLMKNIELYPFSQFSWRNTSHWVLWV